MISIIIPVFNEERRIAKLIQHLHECDRNSLNVSEIIVVDGGSTDETVRTAKELGAKIIQGEKASRTYLFNLGAKSAQSEWLFFIPVDTFPPRTFPLMIVKHIKSGGLFGVFVIKYHSTRFLLKLYSFFQNLPFVLKRIGGKPFFVRKDLFLESGGYDEHSFYMEDVPLLKKLNRTGKLKIIKKEAKRSARHYRLNGYYKLAFYQFLSFAMIVIGISRAKVSKMYKRNIIKGEM